MNAETKKNIRIGFFAIAAFVILCLGLSFLKGRDVFFRGNKYYAYYADVNGLTDASPIIYNGYKIGAVRDVVIDQYAADVNKRFKVTLAVTENIDIPSNSVAEIVSTDILGGKGVQFQFGDSPNNASNGDVLTGSVQVGLTEQIMPMKNKAELLIESAGSVMTDVDSLIGDRNRAMLNTAIASLAVTMKNLEAITKNIESLTGKNGGIAGTFSSTNGFMTKLNEQTGRIDSVMDNVNNFTAELASAQLGNAISNLDSALIGINELLADVNKGNGSLGLLASDRQLYDNLATATENLNRLLVDVRLNPSRYVNISAFEFGRKIYFSDSNTASDMLGNVYVVCLTKTKEPFDAPTNIAGHKILEYKSGKKYKYLVSSFESVDAAQIFIEQNNIKNQFPNAEIEAYENGKQVDIK